MPSPRTSYQSVRSVRLYKVMVSHTYMSHALKRSNGDAEAGFDSVEKSKAKAQTEMDEKNFFFEIILNLYIGIKII